MKPIIAPSILSADFARLEKDVKEAEKGGADYFHCDIADGTFVPNISFGPLIVRTMKKITNVPLDVHLMIVNPDKYIPEFARAGADIITPHIEAPYDVYRSVQLVTEVGAKAGIALNPGTPISQVEPLIEKIDYVLLMSVCPGFGGQKFFPEMLNKIRNLRDMLDDLKPSVHLAIDGGVNKDNIVEIYEAGANFLIAGSAVFGAESIENAVKELKGAITK